MKYYTAEFSILIGQPFSLQHIVVPVTTKTLKTSVIVDTGRFFLKESPVSEVRNSKTVPSQKDLSVKFANEKNFV